MIIPCVVLLCGLSGTARLARLAYFQAGCWFGNTFHSVTEGSTAPLQGPPSGLTSTKAWLSQSAHDYKMITS
ncbi:hypothetical protein [Chitinimonas taiwanensis]|nr:hypothetical protein [Chitinimonas taiwanensis]